MYFGWHKRLSKVAWVLITLSILTAIVYLIVGVAGGWNCDFSCSENDGDAQLLNEGVYSCHSDKHGDPEVNDGSGAHFTPGFHPVHSHCNVPMLSAIWTSRVQHQIQWTQAMRCGLCCKPREQLCARIALRRTHSTAFAHCTYL